MAGSTKHNAKTKSVDLRLSEAGIPPFWQPAEVSGLPMSGWMQERLRRAIAEEVES